MSEYIDLTCEEEYEFSDMEGITEEDLLAIDVCEVQRQAELFNDFPKCHISQGPRDIVGRALERAMREGEGEEIEIVTPTKDNLGISVEESAKEVENVEKFVAKKSAPDSEDRCIQITVKAMGYEVKEEVMEMDSLDDSGFVDDMGRADTEVGSSDSNGANGLKDKTGKKQDNAIMDNGCEDGTNGSDDFRSAKEIGVQQQQQQQQKRAESGLKFNFDKIVIPFASTKGMTEENMSISSQITKAVVEVSSLKSSEGGNIFKNGESGFIKHDFPMVDSEKLRGPDPSPIDIDSGAFISIREVAIPGKKTMRTVPFGVGIISLILVDFVDGKWKVPSIREWEDMVNTMEEKVIREYSSLRYIMAQTVRWKGCGSFGLRGDDVELLEA